MKKGTINILGTDYKISVCTEEERPKFGDNNGITELYLIDESFVRSALIHEAERLREERNKLLRRISDMNSHEEEEE